MLSHCKTLKKLGRCIETMYPVFSMNWVKQHTDQFILTHQLWCSIINYSYTADYAIVEHGQNIVTL
jgi:hypothetical protein